MARETGTSSRKLRGTMGILSIALAITLTILIGIVIQYYGHEVRGSELPLFVGIAGGGFSLVLMWLLDRNQAFGDKFRRGKYNLKWLAIVPLSLAFILVAFTFYVLAAEFEISKIDDMDLDIQANQDLLIFLVSGVFSTLIVQLVFWGGKNLNFQLPFHKIKFGAFGGVIIIFLILTAGASYALYRLVTFLPPAVASDYDHNDGPWVTWATSDPTTEACISWLTKEAGETRLLLGETPSLISQEWNGEGATHLHRIYLKGLRPDTRYYYKIPGITFEQGHPAAYFSFQTAPSTARAFKFIVVGDMQPNREGLFLSNQLVASGMINETADFICQVGDAADSGGDKGDWHYLFNSLAPVAANTPFMGTIGNHDWDGGTEKGSNWAGIFTYPYAQPNHGRFYSFDYLDAHFTMIDNFEHAYSITDPQLQWIKKDLADAKARGQDWLFCFFHLSIFSSYTANMYYDLQEQLVPIFDKYDVDAVFYGHDHAYEHYSYEYGWNGLLHDPAHASWEHNKVEYFLTGGGGGALEYEYGVTRRSTETFSLEWYDTNQGGWTTKTYERRPWDSKKLMNNTGNPDFEPAPNGLQYYQDPREEIYQDDVVEYGLQYGENTLHYMTVEIDGGTCTISTHYPNGDILTGPRGDLPQVFTLTK